MSCPPPVPPRPCECGCPEKVAQKQRKGPQKRFFSDACQKRKAKRESEEAREYAALRMRLVRAGEVERTPRPARTPDEQVENERRRAAELYAKDKARILAQRKQRAAAHPTANAEACRRWREKRRQKLAASHRSE